MYTWVVLLDSPALAPAFWWSTLGPHWKPPVDYLPPLVLPADAGELTRLGPLLLLVARVVLPGASRSVREAASEGG